MGMDLPTSYADADQLLPFVYAAYGFALLVIGFAITQSTLKLTKNKKKLDKATNHDS